jgi:hypothetical protein
MRSYDIRGRRGIREVGQLMVRCTKRQSSLKRRGCGGGGPKSSDVEGSLATGGGREVEGMWRQGLALALVEEMRAGEKAIAVAERPILKAVEKS